MFGNKIVISKEQYETIKGAAKMSGSKEFDVGYSIIEFGVCFLISISFDKESGNNEKINESIRAWKAEPEAMNMTNSLIKYLALENKKEYIANRDFFSFIGVHIINVEPEHKNTIKGLANLTGLPQKVISYILFESGITFMMLASESSAEKIKDTLYEWMNDDDIMKVADGLRRAWEASQQMSNDK